MFYNVRFNGVLLVCKAKPFRYVTCIIIIVLVVNNSKSRPGAQKETKVACINT